MKQQKKKIIILGGGMSALTAAHELTNYDGWQEQYEITIYQTGWRLGGKTATGRGKQDRIEEHGIHILQGWYDTTFRLLRSVYEERKNKNLAPDSPLQDLFKDGLQRNNTTLLTEFIPELGKWVNCPFILPESDDLPGEGEPLDTGQLLRRGCGIMLEFALGSPYSADTNWFSKWILYHFFPKGSTVTSNQGCLYPLLKPFLGKKGLLARLLPKSYQHLLEAWHLCQEHIVDDFQEHHQKILGALEKYIKKTKHDKLHFTEKEAQSSYLKVMIAFAYYNLKGVLEDVYDFKTQQFNFRAVNDLDYRAWLAKQGAPDWVLQSVFVRFFYTGTFANLVNEQGGALGAGTALQFGINSIGYKGSFVFQFVYGTGDVMVMPMYEVLKNRGVQFKFFHTIEQVHYGASDTIENISFAEQVELVVPEYNPIHKVGKLNTWPSEPNYAQITPKEVARLKAGNINLEDPWADWSPFRKGKLQKGVDFDEVILGIPIGTLKTICSEIIEKKPTWQLMVDHVQTTPTQSAQLWLLPSLQELGFNPTDWGLPSVNGAANVVLYQNPMYSWLDSSLVLPNENWPANQLPKFLAYYTGPMVLRHPLPPFSDHTYPAQEMARLIDSFEQWLNDNMAWFWPAGASISYPNGLDFQLLAHPNNPNTTDGYERFIHQYFRANVRPTDHYTLSVPNSEKYRLKTGESGFENLWLCGDWIDFGANVGYIDGAIQSGLQAAQALCKKRGLGKDRNLKNKK
jgi:uncharacterized protein with NAD-binding domain and iron-sulfur cluster